MPRRELRHKYPLRRPTEHGTQESKRQTPPYELVNLRASHYSKILNKPDVRRSGIPPSSWYTQQAGHWSVENGKKTN